MENLTAVDRRVGSGDAMTSVLVVDDEPDIRASLAAWLAHRLSWETRVAATGVEALRVASEWRPDVVVSDYRMPNMDGIEFLTELRRRLPGVRTMLLTAELDVEVARRAEQDEAVDCVLSKMVDAEEVVAAARRLDADAKG